MTAHRVLYVLMQELRLSQCFFLQNDIENYFMLEYTIRKILR